MSRSALLLIGGPIAGALLVWLMVSAFNSNPSTEPEAVTEQPASELAIEAQSAVEMPPAVEEDSVPVPVEADQAPIEPELAAVEPEPAPVDPEPAAPVEAQPREPSGASSSAINEVIPNVPQSALDTISGTVRVSVRVTIDKEGTVIDAIADDGGPSRYFERLSVAASRRWTFVPANGEEPRTMLVKFNFTRAGVTAQASPDA